MVTLGSNQVQTDKGEGGFTKSPTGAKTCKHRQNKE